MAAAPAEATLTLGGMHCAACVSRVEKALKAVPGVDQARVNLATRQARVFFDPRRTALPALQKAVEDAGYQVEALSTDDRRPPPTPEKETLAFRRRFLLALVLSLPVLVPSMAPSLATALGLSPRQLFQLLFWCTTPVLFIPGAPFFVGARHWGGFRMGYRVQGHAGNARR